jgi:hypothetical protein
MDGVRVTGAALDLATLVRSIPPEIRSKPGSIPVGPIVEAEAACLLPGSLLFYFCQPAQRVNFVGISVGIGNDRRQKLLYVQMVMAAGGYRPGAPR